MKENSEYNRNDGPMSGIDIFKNGKFHWKKTEDEVWAEMEEKLSDENSIKIRKLHFRPTIISIAASVAILVGLVSFMRFYGASVYSEPGIHKIANLPDGSTVNLNAESELTYYPLWWKFKRVIKFKGEGFFKVQKGNKFIVHTPAGDVEVLGTSFNIFAREEASNVSCVTGKVKVTAQNNEEVVLTPNTKAELFENKSIKVTMDIDVASELAWQKNIFNFELEPLKNVFLEIERQYGVKIEMKFSTSFVYSGYFQKEDNVENILNYVCSAMGLTFKKKSVNEYIILQE